MATCRFERDVERCFDGDASTTTDVERHLETCSQCKIFLSELEQMRNAIESVSVDAEIAEEQFPAFMRGIEEGLAKPQPRPVGLWAMASGIAAALIVALSLISIVSSGPEPIQAVKIEETSTDISGATTEAVVLNEETTMVWINLPDGDML